METMRRQVAQFVAVVFVVPSLVVLDRLAMYGCTACSPIRGLWSWVSGCIFVCETARAIQSARLFSVNRVNLRATNVGSPLHSILRATVCERRFVRSPLRVRMQWLTRSFVS